MDPQDQQTLLPEGLLDICISRDHSCPSQSPLLRCLLTTQESRAPALPCSHPGCLCLEEGCHMVGPLCPCGLVSGYLQTTNPKGAQLLIKNGAVSVYPACSQPVYILPYTVVSRLLTISCCCCSVPQSCLTLSNPLDCSMPGFPAIHHLLKLAQTHVH